MRHFLGMAILPWQYGSFDMSSTRKSDQARLEQRKHNERQRQRRVKRKRERIRKQRLAYGR